jgi:uridine kinase
LCRELGQDEAVAISFDAYYRDLSHLPMADRAATNFDHPDSLDGDLLAHHLAELGAGREIPLPVYDFATYARTGDVEFVSPRPYIIVEGILLFAFAGIRARLDHLIFRHCDEATRAQRRLERDVVERGRTPESVQHQWQTTVQPMHDQFVEPFARYATARTTSDQELDAAAADLARTVQTTGPLALL